MSWFTALAPVIPMAISAIAGLINGKHGRHGSGPIVQGDFAAEERNHALEARNRELAEQMYRNQIEQQKRNEELIAQNNKLREDIERYQREHEQQLKEMTKLLAELKEKKLNSFEAIEAHDKKAKEALIQLAKQA
ncbi:unnamed protein product, partial [Rotaria sp. Silwood2]